MVVEQIEQRLLIRFVALGAQQFVQKGEVVACELQIARQRSVQGIDVVNSIRDIINRLFCTVAFSQIFSEEYHFGFASEIYQKIFRTTFFNKCLPSKVTIQRARGGVNMSFFVTYKAKQYFLRTNKRSNPVLQRFCCCELQNLVTQRQGIFERALQPLVDSTMTDRTLITEYIADGRVAVENDFLGKNGRKYLRMLATMLKRLHTFSTRFSNEVSVFERIRELYKYLESRGELYFVISSHLFNILGDIEKIFDSLIQKTPCHNDVCIYNILVTKQELILIDWEMSGNNDPAWDLAYFTNGLGLGQIEEDVMLEAYHIERTDTTFKNRMEIYKPIIELWVALWMCFQAAIGSDVMSQEKFRDMAMEKYFTAKQSMEEVPFLSAISRLDQYRCSFFSQPFNSISTVAAPSSTIASASIL